jgi:hypothetical protein
MNVSNDVIVDVQDKFNDFLSNINNTIGSFKNHLSLTLPYGFEHITTALDEFKKR